MRNFLRVSSTAYLVVSVTFATLSCKTWNHTAEIKLIGGNIATAGDYPGTINLLRVSEDISGGAAGGKPLMKSGCSGAVIAPTFILTAAHCVIDASIAKVGFNIEPFYEAGVRFYFAHGLKAERTFHSVVKRVSVHPTTSALLRKLGTWSMPAIRDFKDIAVIELVDPVDSSIGITHLAATLDHTTDPRFIYGGYGCEVGGPEISPVPAAPTPTDLGPYDSRLKYTTSTISKVYATVAEGQQYTTTTHQSGCPGDSGGSVYKYAAKGPFMEVIGINSYGRSPGEVPGETATELGFSVVTADSELGLWVTDVVKGTAIIATDISPLPCNSRSPLVSDALCEPGHVMSCSLSQHATIEGFPFRNVGVGACLKRSGPGLLEDPRALIASFHFAKNSVTPLWQQTVYGNQFALFPATPFVTSKVKWLCYESSAGIGAAEAAALADRIKLAVLQISLSKDEPLISHLPFLIRTSSTPVVDSVSLSSDAKLFVIGYQLGSRKSLSQIPACGQDFGLGI